MLKILKFVYDIKIVLIIFIEYICKYKDSL